MNLHVHISECTIKRAQKKKNQRKVRISSGICNKKVFVPYLQFVKKAVFFSVVMFEEKIQRTRLGRALYAKTTYIQCSANAI